MDASKLVQCGAVIILAGMPRTGSTWQMEMVKSVANALNVTIEHSGYWDYAKHIGMDAKDAKRYYESEYQQWAKLRPDSVIAYKSHEFDSTLVSKCQKQVIFTSHRCLEDELGSASKSWNVSTKVFLNNIVHEYTMWKKYNTLDMDYDNARKHPHLAINMVGFWLALSLNISIPPHVKFDPVLMEANPGIPSSTASLDTPTTMSLRQHFKHPVLRFCTKVP